MTTELRHDLPKTAPKVQTWESVRCKLIQLMPADGYTAIFGIWSEDQGYWCRYSEPVAFLALAEVTCTKRRQTGEGDAFIVRTDTDNEIVGVQFDGGSFEVTREASNYFGLCPSGGDIRDVNDYRCYTDFPKEDEQINPAANL